MQGIWRVRKNMKIRKFKLYIMALILTVSFAAAPEAYAMGTVSVPEDVREISEELGPKYNICPELIQAICWKESRFQPDAESDGCVGIMQVAPKWHQDRMKRLGVTDLKDTRQNMVVAVDYLSELLEEGEDMEEPLMRYHGESRIAEKLDSGEMSEYVDAVLALSAELEAINGK